MSALSVATPSWYDVLDVPPDASEPEIRAAWRQAIAELEPGERRFRLLNLAAEVLLDRDRRAAYDIELSSHSDVAGEGAPSVEDASASNGASVSRPTEVTGESGTTTAARRGWVVPGWLLVFVAAIAALAVGACAVVAATAPSDAKVADATRDAQTAAERAIVPILSYDAAHLDADQRAAERFMTSDYREQYARLFEVVKSNAPSTGTVVTAEVIASGVVRSGDDRVAILVFVNRPTTNKQLGEPVVYKDQVTVTMQRVGDAWLVDDLVTSPAG
jgi:Mce-associated membrane protein